MIDEASIIAKAKAAMATAPRQAEVNEKIDKIVRGASGRKTAVNAPRPTEAADKLIELIKKNIDARATQGTGMATANGGLGPGAVAALSNMSRTDAAAIIPGRLYEISISFDNDLSRESLAPDEYYGVDNIAVLLNNGYSAHGYVYGEWHGDRIRSLKDRAGAHFVTDAIAEFKAKYASEYGVTDISSNQGYD